MGKYSVKFTKEAKSDLKIQYHSGNQSSIRKIEKILIELSVHPYSGIGKPEPLKHEFSGYWSRRVNKKDRIVYRVDEDIVTIFVVSAIGHYSDR